MEGPADGAGSCRDIALDHVLAGPVPDVGVGRVDRDTVAGERAALTILSSLIHFQVGHARVLSVESRRRVLIVPVVEWELTQGWDGF